MTPDRAHDGPPHVRQGTVWVGSPTATANPEQPPGPAARSRKLVVAGLAGMIVLVAGVVLGTTVRHHGKHGHLTQDRFCDMVKKVEDFASTNAVISLGGPAPADIPRLPTGSSATCTVKHTGEDSNLHSFYAAYEHGTDLTGYRATLKAHGFHEEALPGIPATKPDRKTLVDGHGRTIDVLADFGGVEVIQIFEIALPSRR